MDSNDDITNPLTNGKLGIDPAARVTSQLTVWMTSELLLSPPPFGKAAFYIRDVA